MIETYTNILYVSLLENLSRDIYPVKGGKPNLSYNGKNTVYHNASVQKLNILKMLSQNLQLSHCTWILR